MSYRISEAPATVKSWICSADARGFVGRNMDAVGLYHAGHGPRGRKNGVFHLPMGALGGRGRMPVSALSR